MMVDRKEPGYKITPIGILRESHFSDFGPLIKSSRLNELFPEGVTYAYGLRLHFDETLWTAPNGCVVGCLLTSELPDDVPAIDDKNVAYGCV